MSSTPISIGRASPAAARVPWDRTVIYETHLRGFTKLHPAVKEELRGTYKGISQKEVVDYIRALGITSVELLPVHTFISDSYLVEKGLTNYWGYNSIGFFAPDPGYAHEREQTLREFKEMVARFHEAGLEVILDVVYNHTAEGNELGPTLSFKGIDNASYYRLMPDQPRYFINDTGTGNTLNLDPNPGHPDGDGQPALLGERNPCRRLPLRPGHHPRPRAGRLQQRKRVPQGVLPGPGSEHGQADRRTVGLRTRRLSGRRLPAGLGRVERQIPRHRARFLARRGAGRGAGAAPCAARPTVSTAAAARPWASVNFVAAHDGFTVNDLVTYNDKHNEANGEDNRDGSDDNRSWNCGVEGPSDDPDVERLRLRQIKNILATLLLSLGTPMLLAGDEFGRTQGGNNNAYCQDNEISWLDWDIADKGRRADRLCPGGDRLTPEIPGPAAQPFLTGENDGELGVKDVTWINAAGVEMQEEHWADERMHCFGMLLDGRAQATGIRRPGEDASLLLVFNAHDDVVEFALPQTAGGDIWELLLDTNLAENAEKGRFRTGESYSTTGRSLLVFVLNGDS